MINGMKARLHRRVDMFYLTQFCFWVNARFGIFPSVADSSPSVLSSVGAAEAAAVEGLVLSLKSVFAPGIGAIVAFDELPIGALCEGGMILSPIFVVSGPAAFRLFYAPVLAESTGMGGAILSSLVMARHFSLPMRIFAIVSFKTPAVVGMLVWVAVMAAEAMLVLVTPCGAVFVSVVFGAIVSVMTVVTIFRIVVALVISIVGS